MASNRPAIMPRVALRSSRDEVAFFQCASAIRVRSGRREFRLYGGAMFGVGSQGEPGGKKKKKLSFAFPATHDEIVCA